MIIIIMIKIIIIMIIISCLIDFVISMFSRPPSDDDGEEAPLQGLTLQEAFCAKRSEFIAASRARGAATKQARNKSHLGKSMAAWKKSRSSKPPPPPEKGKTQ